MPSLISPYKIGLYARGYVFAVHCSPTHHVLTALEQRSAFTLGLAVEEGHTELGKVLLCYVAARLVQPVHNLHGGGGAIDECSEQSEPRLWSEDGQERSASHLKKRRTVSNHYLAFTFWWQRSNGERSMYCFACARNFSSALRTSKLTGACSECELPFASSGDGR